MSRPNDNTTQGMLPPANGQTGKPLAKGAFGAAPAACGSTPDSVEDGARGDEIHHSYSDTVHLDIPTVTEAPGYKHLDAILKNAHHLAPHSPFALAEALSTKPTLLLVMKYFHALTELVGANYDRIGHHKLLPPDGRPNAGLPTVIGAEGTTRHFRFWFGEPVNCLGIDHDMLDSAIKALVECGVFISARNTSDGVRVDIRTLDAVALLQCAQTSPRITLQDAPPGVLRALTDDYEELTLPYVAARATPLYPGNFLREWPAKQGATR